MRELIKCAVKTCQNENIKLFKCPGPKSQRKKWSNALEISNDEEYYVCELHFDKKFINFEKLLAKEAVPSIFINEKVDDDNICQCCRCFASLTHEINAFHREIFEIMFDQIKLNDGVICGYCNEQILEMNRFRSIVVEAHRSYSSPKKDVLNDLVIKTEPDCYDFENSTMPSNYFFKSENSLDNLTPETPSFEKIEEVTMSSKVKSKAVVSKKNKKVYECQLCPFSSIDKYAFTEHLIEIHAENEDDDLEYENYEELEEEMEPDSDTRPYICDICQKVHQSKYALIDHMKIHTLMPVKCPECSAILNSTRELTRHKNEAHSNGTRFWCSECTRVFDTKKQQRMCFKSHSKQLNNISVKCPECDKAVLYKNLKNHQLNAHSSIRNEICDQCGKGFVSRVFLANHMARVHSDILKSKKIYECDFCGLKYLSKSSLLVHMCSHRENREVFQCPICLKKMFSHIANHMRSAHPNGRDNGYRVNPETNAYHCPNCIQQFPGHKRYEKHVKSNICSNFGDFEIESTNKKVTVFTKGKFTCNICNKMKNSMYTLRKHMNNYHIGEQKCPICEKKLSSKKSVYKHLKNIHKTSMKLLNSMERPK